MKNISSTLTISIPNFPSEINRYISALFTVIDISLSILVSTYVQFCIYNYPNEITRHIDYPGPQTSLRVPREHSPIRIVKYSRARGCG